MDDLINFSEPTRSVLDNEKAKEIKSKEQIEFEKTPEEVEKYQKYREKRALEIMQKNKEHLDDIRDDVRRFEKDEKLGLDGGIRHEDMPRDSAGRKLNQSEILLAKYFVATQNVGISLKMAGLPTSCKRLLQKPEMRAYMAELTDMKLKRMGYDRNTVLKNLAIIANQDIADYMDIVKEEVTSKNGNTYVRTDIDMKSIEEINNDVLRDEFGDEILDVNGRPIMINNEKSKAIKSIRYLDNGKVVFEFHDKLTALKQLANMLDMESPQKITLNDETHRTETENALLKKLQAFADNKEKNKATNDNEKEVEDTSEQEG